jgi:hypothetical protein
VPIAPIHKRALSLQSQTVLAHFLCAGYIESIVDRPGSQ